MVPVGLVPQTAVGRASVPKLEMVWVCDVLITYGGAQGLLALSGSNNKVG